MSAKRSMSCGAENRSRGPLLNPGVPLRPRRDAPSLLLSGFWFAAPQRRVLFSVLYCSFALSRSDSEEGSAHAEGR